MTDIAPTVSKNPWKNQETVEALKALLADDRKLTATEIAAEMWEKHRVPVTRSAVMGKASRLKIDLPNRGHRIVRYRHRPTVEQPDIPASMTAESVASDQRKQLLDLGPHDCRWPFGDVGEPDFFFCGAVQSFGSSYCPFHTRMSGRQNG